MAYYSKKTYLSYPKAYSSGVGTLSKESYVLTEATNIVIDGDYNYVTFTHSLYGKADKKVTATANLTAVFDSTKSVSKEVTLTTSIKKLITLTETVKCEFGIETSVSGSLSTGFGGYGITTDPDAWSRTTVTLYTFGRVTSYNKHEKYAVPFTVTLSKPGNYRLEFYENSESEVCRHTVEFSGDSVDVTIPATVYKEVGGDLTRMKCFEQAQDVWVIADSESITVSETACSISIKAVRSPSNTDPSLVTIAVKGESAASSAYRTVTIYAKETSASEWAVIGTASPDTSSFSETLSIDLSIDYTWDIYASVSDGYTSAESMKVRIYSRFYIMDVRTDGKGIAFGGTAANEDEMYCGFGTLRAEKITVGDCTTGDIVAGDITAKNVTPTNITGIANLIYPVGSIYMSVNSTSPATLFGGTWEQISGRFLLASGDGYTSGATGGEAMHTLTTSEMPSHTHGSKELKGTFRGLSWKSGTATGIVSYGTHNNDRTASNGTNFGAVTATIDATHEHNSVGGDKPHNNMPPYLVVNVWKRTA